MLNESETKQLQLWYWLWVKTNGIGAPPILVYFSGDWDVHWGTGFDPWPFRASTPASQVGGHQTPDEREELMSKARGSFWTLSVGERDPKRGVVTMAPVWTLVPSLQSGSNKGPISQCQALLRFLFYVLACKTCQATHEDLLVGWTRSREATDQGSHCPLVSAQ